MSLVNWWQSRVNKLLQFTLFVQTMENVKTWKVGYLTVVLSVIMHATVEVNTWASEDFSCIIEGLRAIASCCFCSDSLEFLHVTLNSFRKRCSNALFIYCTKQDTICHDCKLVRFKVLQAWIVMYEPPTIITQYQHGYSPHWTHL